MKIFTLLMCFVLLPLLLGAQSEMKTYKYASLTSAFGRSMNTPCKLYVVSTKSEYYLDGTYTAGQTISKAIADGKCQPTGSIFSYTDTTALCPLGKGCFRAADSTWWVRIKLTGTKAERWNKLTKGK